MKTFSLLEIERVVGERAKDFIIDLTKNFKPGEENSMFDALMDYAEVNDIEIETVGQIAKSIPSILSTVTAECEKLNILPKTARLDL